MLAITHRSVLAMGGNLTGESELGIGSTFTLRPARRHEIPSRETACAESQQPLYPGYP
jgi:hypothetical protein